MCTYNSIAHKDSSLPLSVCCLCVCVSMCSLSPPLCVERSSSFGPFLSPECNRNETIHPPLSLSLFLYVCSYTRHHQHDRSLSLFSVTLCSLSSPNCQSQPSPHSSPPPLPSPSSSLPRVLPLLTLFVVLPQRINRSYLSL